MAGFHLKSALCKFAFHTAAVPVRNRPLADLRKVRMNKYMHAIRNMKQQKCVFNQCKHFMQAIAAMGCCRLGQPDHAKSEHLLGGRNRAAAAMQLELQVQTTQGAVQFQSWREQTGRHRAPDKVRLRLDSIQLAPCYLRQPTRILHQNHTGLQGQPPYRARCQCCGCNYDSTMVTLPNICNHSTTAMQANATAVRSKQLNSRRCSSK